MTCRSSRSRPGRSAGTPTCWSSTRDEGSVRSRAAEWRQVFGTGVGVPVTRLPGWPAHRLAGAEMGPVDLGLFARQATQTQVGLGLGSAFFIVAMWALGAWLGEKIAVPPVIPRTRGG